MEFEETISEAQIQQWVREAKQAAENPEHAWDKKAMDWPLTAESIVLEVGSFKGRWALQIAQKYNPRLFCFEPQSWAWEVTKQVLTDYNAKVFNFGLGTRSAMLPMAFYGTDGCRFAEKGEPDHTAPKVLGQMHEISAALGGLGISRIDLMLVNIEGYEYTLIPHMFAQGIFPLRLMVQFHTGNYLDLKRQIDKHYDLLWHYGRKLSAWELETSP